MNKPPFELEKIPWNRRQSWPPSTWEDKPWRQLEFLRAVSVFCTNPRFIFVHIGKCAGTSIHRHVIKPEKGVQCQNSPKLNYALDSDMFDDYWKFTVCRNPYDRAMSAFKYFKAFGSFQNEKQDYISLDGVEFEQFVLEFMFDENGDPINKQWVPQHLHTHFVDGTQFVDDIFKLEELEKHWEYIRTVCKFHTLTLPNSNNTSFREASLDHYTEAARKVIADYYSKDFEVFGYDK